MDKQTKTVSTHSGLIRGALNTALFGQDYWSYEGIPYAQPAVGELRFLSPKPVLPWVGTLDAFQQGPACCSIDPALMGVLGSEDCLHLNIYVKQMSMDEHQLVPVMVFLHGGAFMYGSSGKELFGPDYFMTQPIALVTLNYRLGAFGFLTLDDQDVPGNAGLKDQRLALRWIQQNIHSFGGDPNNVTLCGESAGACSAHFHLLSRNSRNLFHRAILMSGCVLNPWATIDRHLTMGKRLASRLGWLPEMEDDMLSFLQRATAEDLTREQDNLLTAAEKEKHILFPFGPVVEPFDSDDCVITVSPIAMSQNESVWSYLNKVPVLILGTSEEGLYLRGQVVGKGSVNVLHYITNLVPSDAKRETQMAIKFKEFYFQSNDIAEDGLMSFIDFMSDKWFWHGLHRTIIGRTARDCGSTFVLRFNVDLGPFNHFKTLMCGEGIKGTCHVDNCSYLFRPKCVENVDAGSLEKDIITTMIEVFMSFAESGKPKIPDSTLTNRWIQATKGDGFYQCLNVSENGNTFIELPEQRRMRFWDSLYEPSTLC